MTLEILVLDDEAGVGRAVRRMAPPDVSARTTTSKLRAIELLRDLAWPCAVALIDARLGDDLLGGFDVLDVARAERPEIKCFLVTGSSDICVGREAFARRVPILPKPFSKRELESIFDDARIDAKQSPSDGLGEAIEKRALEWQLSPKLREVTQMLVTNPRRPHEQTAQALGMKLSTLRAHVRELLERSELTSVDALRETVLRDALSLSLREAGQVARRRPHGRGPGVQRSPRGRGTRAQIANHHCIASSRHTPRCLVHLARVSQRGECRVRILAAGLVDGQGHAERSGNHPVGG